MSVRIEVRQTDGGRPWYLRLVSTNGQVLLHSESYSTKWNAKRAARRLSRMFGVPVVSQ